MIRKRGIDSAVRLLMVVVVVSMGFAVSVQPAAAQVLDVDQIVYPEPASFLFNLGTQSELFWWKITIADTTPDMVTHRIFDLDGIVVHNDSWDVHGFPSPIFNPENTVGDSAHGNVLDQLHAHAWVVPAGAEPGIYLSEVRYDYSSEISNPSSYGISSESIGADNFHLTSTVPFVIKQPLTIFKYNDLNGNGQFNTGEPGLDGWEFTVVGPPNAFGSGVNTFSGTTSAGGFRDVPAIEVWGYYTITEVSKPGWTNTDPPGGPLVQKVINIPDDIDLSSPRVLFGDSAGVVTPLPGISTPGIGLMITALAAAMIYLAKRKARSARP